MHDAYESCPILKLNNSIDSLAAYGKFTIFLVEC